MRAVVAALTPALLLAAFSLHAAAPDLPPAGRSLFDHLTMLETGGRSVQRIPYPFEALLRALEQRTGADALGRPGVPAVLIPLGRSLQRNVSSGQYFEHPRVVAAVTGEARRLGSASGPLLKDKLFIGFQDQAGVIEVISYNEAAGRFEFQVVKNYRPGHEPQVFYARRTVCTACHHGAAPIFSRPSWDETNANPAVARALAARSRTFHGVPVARGVDVPNAIDDAVARANRLSLVQAVWRDGCARAANGSDPVACRGAALRAALKLRLSRSGEVDLASARARTELLLPLSAAWSAQWPAGLPEPDPNIPNRDPYFGASQRLAPAQPAATPWGADEISPSIDPLALRAPSAVWRGDPAGIEYFVRALAAMLAASDIDALDRWLQRVPLHGGARERDRIELACQASAASVAANLDLRCESATDGATTVSLVGSLRLDGARASGTLARLQLAAGSLREVALTPVAIERRGQFRRAHLRVASTDAGARLADGRLLEAFELAWPDPRGAASYSAGLILKDDFAALEPAITAVMNATRRGASDVLAALPFRRTATVRALFAQLGIEGAPTCCDQAQPELPPAQLDAEESKAAHAIPASLRPFYRYCGACHDSRDASPPGFLHGDLARVETYLERCAPRIQYRLDMWRLTPAERSKVPMPPPSFAAAWENTPPADDLALMRSHIARLLGRAQHATTPDRAYESLPACRMDAPASGASVRH